MKRYDPFVRAERRILWMSLGTVFVCLFVFAAAVSLIYAKSLVEVDNRQLAEQYRILIGAQNELSLEMLIDGPKAFPDGQHKEPPKFGKNIMLVVYEEGQLLGVRQNPFFSETELPNLPLDTNGKYVNFEQGGNQFRGLAYTEGSRSYQLILNTDPEFRAITTLNATLTAGLLILIGLAALAAKFLARLVMVPVKAAYQDQVQFIQDSSHEMRTPLAVMKSALDLMIRSPEDSVSQHSQQVSQMMGELRNLEQLNSHLLMLSKELIDEQGELSQLLLKPYLDEYAQYYLDLAELQEKHFELNLPDDRLEVRWDAHKMRRALTILMENAFKYTSPGDLIRLSCRSEGSKVFLVVEDSGIGISEEELPKIYNRFYRSPQVRGLNIDGSGIGLSLLKAISESLHIKISVSSKPGEGTRFTLEVPAQM